MTRPAQQEALPDMDSTNPRPKVSAGAKAPGAAPAGAGVRNRRPEGGRSGLGGGMRLDPRVRVDLPVEVLPPVRDGVSPMRMQARNLSGVGVLCHGDRPLDLDNMVGCRLNLPRGGAWPEQVQTDAIVLRRESVPGGEGRETWSVSLYFVDMEPADREAVRRFVFSRLRQRAADGTPR